MAILPLSYYRAPFPIAGVEQSDEAFEPKELGMRLTWLTAFLGLAAATFAAAPAALAQSEQQQLIDQATGVVESFQNQGQYLTDVRELVKRARAIIIVPQMVQAGFIFGAQGGSGVLLAHEKNGSWSYPAFYHLGAASFGFQAGAEVSQVVLIIMSDRALDSALQDAQVKLGAEAGLAVATVGAGAQGNLVAPAGADIYALSSSKGLFGGVAIQGGAIGPAHDMDSAYYGRSVSAPDIVLRGAAKNRGAEALRAALRHL
jgi:SH3 domain-containing YSC84-like protein 1